MGANEKHAATYHGGEYTPSTGEIVNAWIKHRAHHYQGLVSSDQIIQDLSAEISRGMDKIRAEAKAEALREAAGEFQVNTWASVLTGGIVTRTRNGQEVSDWLRARANQYKEEPGNGR